MSRVVIDGTPKEINEKLATMLAINDEMRSRGFDAFTHRAEWVYRTTSSNPCDVCKGYARQAIFRGDTIEQTFPRWFSLGPGMIHPNVHVPLGWNTPCYCILILSNATDVATEQLMERYEVVM